MCVRAYVRVCVCVCTCVCACVRACGWTCTINGNNTDARIAWSERVHNQVNGAPLDSGAGEPPGVGVDGVSRAGAVVLRVGV